MRGGKANKKKKKHRRRRKMIVRKRVYSANTTTVATIINEGMHKNWKPNQNGSKRTTSRRYKDSNNDTHMLLAAVAVVKNKNMFGDTPRTQPHLRSKIQKTQLPGAPASHRYKHTHARRRPPNFERAAGEQRSSCGRAQHEDASVENCLQRLISQGSRQSTATSTLQGAPSSFG